MSGVVVAVHELRTELDPLPMLIHAACSCGLQYPAVTAEHEVRHGVTAERHRIHVEEVAA